MGVLLLHALGIAVAATQDCEQGKREKKEKAQTNDDTYVAFSLGVGLVGWLGYTSEQPWKA